MKSHRKGFTLIELLIVVVIIGILAAIAIPKFVNTKEKSYIAAMKSDLKNLSTAEETYFSEFLTYTSSFTTSAYRPTRGVTVAIGTANSTSWVATSTHTGTTKTCILTYGLVSATDGVVVCS